MIYSKSIILLYIISTLIFIGYVSGNVEEGIEYNVDSDGNIISYKKITDNDEIVISTFTPQVEDDNIIPDDLEENKDVENENIINNENEENEEEENEGKDDGNEIINNEEKKEKEEKIIENEERKKNQKEFEKENDNEDEEEINENDYSNEKDPYSEENKEGNEEINENDYSNEKDPYSEENKEGNEEINENDILDEKDPYAEEKVVEVEIVLDETVIISKSNDMGEFFKRNERMVIGCFESLINENYLNFRNASNGIINSASEASENYFNGKALKFVYINDSQCRNTVKRYTGISMFKNDVVYCIQHRCYEYNPNDLINIQKLRNFIEDKNLPLITEYNPTRKDEYKQWNLPLLVYLNNDEETKNQDISKFLSGIAEKYSNELFIFVSDDKTFDIETLDEPRDKNVIIYAPEFQTLYSIQEILEENDSINKVSVESFINQYKLGLLTPRIVFQDFEREWDQDNFVINSVPRYYYPHVLNPLRDSIVIYYKTDCPYSQEFLKTFEKIGKKYANYRTKFSVVKFEAEDQKIPKMSLWRKLEAYPTVVLYKANPLSRTKKYFYIYPDNAGRSAVTLDKWIQNYSFFKPTGIFNEEDYKEKEEMEVDSDELEINEEEEEKINKYLEDPTLIFTRYGYGKELQVVTDEDEDSGEEEAEFFFDNLKTEKEIPLTGVYYELVSTTYSVKVSSYTPPPSIYDDDDDDDDNEKEDE